MLNGKTALITGCNRGIGKAIFDKFISNHADIICCVRKIDNNFLEYINKIKKKNHNKVRILEFDLSDEKQIENAIKNLINEKIKLDILVNNAGIASGSLVEMTPIRNLKQDFQINFFSQIKLIQLTLRLLKKSSNSSVINIGSISGLLSERGTLSYGSSKAALMYATKIMAKEFAVYKIRVNSIAPSVAKTDMLKNMDPNSIKKLLTLSSLKEPLDVDKIADKVLYLASDSSKKVNGEIIKIDGNK